MCHHGMRFDACSFLVLEGQQQFRHVDHGRIDRCDDGSRRTKTVLDGIGNGGRSGSIGYCVVWSSGIFGPGNATLGQSCRHKWTPCRHVMAGGIDRSCRGIAGGLGGALGGRPTQCGIEFGRRPCGPDVDCGQGPDILKSPQPMKGKMMCSGLTLRHPSEGVGTLSFALSAGTALVVVGRNGSGKSTLLKTLAGLLPARAGSVSMDGVEIAAMRPQARARKLAFVPSTPPRGTVLTVQDVIELALEAGGHQADATSVEQSMLQGGVHPWAQLPIDTLSDGMAQRVMLARAAAQSESLILLDEPTAFLDVVGRREVMADIGQWLNVGKAVVLATHDLDAVQESGWADRWMVMRSPSQGGAVLPDEAFSSHAAKSMLMGEE